MSEIPQNFSEQYIGDAQGAANDFLARERGTSLDGGFAAQQLEARVTSVEETAEALLTAHEINGQPGFYAPLSVRNASEFAAAASSLPGYSVLVPAVMAGVRESAFYPAVVSEQDASDSSMRLHVLCRPYRTTGLTRTASTVLAASGQSETAGIGSHDRAPQGDGVEAEHFATLLTIGADTSLQEGWRRGVHVNHEWRQRPNSSVTTEMSSRLFGKDIPQKTITVTKTAVEQGKATLLWHEGMRDEQTGKPETATKRDALVVVQALGFMTLKDQQPRQIDTIKELIA